MDNLVAFFGGYDTWQFAVVSLGSAIIGLGLMIWKAYLIPIPAFGMLLLYLWVDNTVSLASATLNDFSTGFVSTIPVIFGAVEILILSLNFHLKRDTKNNGDTHPADKVEQ